MEMGLKGGSAAFQRFMREIFADLMYQGALTFIEDIVIYSEKWEQHIKLVNKVLKRLTEHNLEAKVGNGISERKKSNVWDLWFHTSVGSQIQTR
jgi:hypothetical protein